MQIALVTYALQIGGVETFMKLLADYFQQEGHTVDLIETSAKGRWSQTFEDEGYKVIRILSNPLRSSIYHAERIANLLRNYDAVILNDAPSAQAALGLLPEKTVAIPVLHMSLTSMVKNAAANSNNWDSLTAVSPAVQESAVISGIEKKKVICIPNGIKVSEQWRKRGYNFSCGDTLRAVYIGAINQIQKGVLHLPGIVSHALACGTKLSLEIIGEGPDMQDLRQRFHQKCPRAVITFYGALPNQKALDVLNASDILLMPSHFEGLPVVLLEAMAGGVVPVVSRLSGCTDFIVEDTVNGLLAETGNEKEFGDAIVKLHNDRALLNTLSRSAWETVLKRFSYTKTGAQYLELINKCQLQREKSKILKRSGSIEKTLLGDFPGLPLFISRLARKSLRMLGLFPPPVQEPLFFNSHHK